MDVKYIKLFRIGGISMLAAFVGSIIYFIFVGPYLGFPTTPTEEALQKIAGAPRALIWLGWFGVLLDMTIVSIALALYFALRDREPAYSALGLATALVASVLVILYDACIPTISWELGRAYATGDPTQKAAALLIMKSVAKWQDMTASVAASILAGLMVGLFGLAMLSSQWFPRWLGVIGIVIGAFLILGAIFYVAEVPMVFFVALIAHFIWLVIGSIYLLRIKPAV